jgi:hypothetical protein
MVAGAFGDAVAARSTPAGAAATTSRTSTPAASNADTMSAGRTTTRPRRGGNSSTTRDPRTARAVRTSAVVLGAGGLLMAVGGAMHPHETSGTLDESLLALLGSPAWLPAHAALIAGMLLVLSGLVLLRHRAAFPQRVRPWLTGTIVAWAVAAPEYVPHLLAGGEHDALAAGAATPMVHTHLALSTFTTPMVGISSALLAVAVARAARTWPARVLAGFGVVGGLAFAAAAPLVAITGNPAVTNLFAAQTLVVVWIVGTAIRLALGTRAPRAHRLS